MDNIPGDNRVDCDLMDQLLITWNAFVKFLKNENSVEEVVLNIFTEFGMHMKIG